MGLLKKNFIKRGSTSSSKSKAGPSTPSPPPPKGILRKPSIHFVTYDEEGRPHTDDPNALPSADGRRASLPTDTLPSTNSSPYPSMARSAQGGRSGTISTTTVGPFRPQTVQSRLQLPKPKPTKYAAHMSYATVNHTPTPNRYCRLHSSTPFPHPGTRCAVRTLQRSLKNDSKRLQDHLEVEEAIKGELWDNPNQDGLKDCSKRNAYKYAVQVAEREWRKKEEFFHVFGGHVRIMTERTGTPVSVHGFQHQVPVVVAACVEELYRRGMQTPDLFDKKITKHTLCMIASYDQLSPKSPLPDLRHEKIHDVANILSVWMNCLPEPLFHRTFCDAFSGWCVEPSLTREAEHKRKIQVRNRKGDDGEYHSETDTDAETDDEETLGLPSFNSRRKRQRRKERAIERAKRHAWADANPELAKANRGMQHQKRYQMYRELLHLETPQVNHARLVMMLIAPHCFSVMLYLLTFLASLLDHPENKITAKMLSEKFAWKLFGGPNKEMAGELLEWLLTRWDRISHGFKSKDAMAWEKNREDEKKREETEERRGSESSNASDRTHDNDPAPQYEQNRRGSGESDRSDAPSYRTAMSDHAQAREERRASSSSPLSQSRPRRHSRSSDQADSRRSSGSSGSSTLASPPPATPALAPRLHDFNPGKPFCSPQPSPAAVELTNPWDAEDTPVISPFKDEDTEYEAEDEDDNEDDSDWGRSQRATFQAIETLLKPKTKDGSKSQPEPTGTEPDAESVYSQDDNLLDEIIDNYSDESRSDIHVPQARDNTASCLIPLVSGERDSRFAEVAPDMDDPARLKRQFEAALAEREQIQKKLELLSQRFNGIQLR